MATDLTQFTGAQLPAHLSKFFEEVGSNIEDRMTVPSLSYEGKVWQISLDGQKTKLMGKPNEDGDVLPLGVFRAVILDYAKRRGRAYYTGGYDPAKPGKPICWSDDGVAPDDSLPAPDAVVEPGTPKKQSLKCDTCPLAAKGSKVTEQGKAVTACSQHRMLAVVPANQLDFEPLRLKIAITSDFDKQSPELEQQGWRAFSNYTDFLKSMGVPHTAAVETRIKFDPGANYPKLIFSPVGLLSEAQIAQILPVVKSQKVQDLLSGRWTPTGPDGVDKNAAPATPAAAPQTLPQAADVPDEEEAQFVPVTPAAEPQAQPESEQLIQQAAAAKVEPEKPKRTPRKPKEEAAPAAAATPPAPGQPGYIEWLQAQLAQAQAAQAQPAPAATPTPAATTIVMEDDDDEMPQLSTKPAAAAAPAATTTPAASTPAAVPADVDKLLDAWGDDD